MTTTVTCPQCLGTGAHHSQCCELCDGTGKVHIRLYRAPVTQLVSALETRLANQIRLAGLPEPQREYRFDPARRWRFDFAWPHLKLAAEVEGGIWLSHDDPQQRSSRHTTGSGFEADCDKYNAAVVQGWRVLRFTPSHVRSGDALVTLSRALCPE
jgi:hypothetical protein